MMVAVLDIETRKKEVYPPHLPKEGDLRPVTRRWQVFMVGVAVLHKPESLSIIDGEEPVILQLLSAWLGKNHVTDIYYSATRQFDEMILKGRFVNARRAHLRTPGPWPALQGAEDYTWKCLPPEPNPDPEGSRLAPVNYDAGRKAEVSEHCRNDVLRLLRRLEATS